MWNVQVGLCFRAIGVFVFAYCVNNAKTLQHAWPRKQHNVRIRVHNQHVLNFVAASLTHIFFYKIHHDFRSVDYSSIDRSCYLNVYDHSSMILPSTFESACSTAGMTYVERAFQGDVKSLSLSYIHVLFQKAQLAEFTSEASILRLYYIKLRYSVLLTLLYQL